MKFFSKLHYFIFGFFDPTNNFFDNTKINNCWGDLSGVSAKSAPLNCSLGAFTMQIILHSERSFVHFFLPVQLAQYDVVHVLHFTSPLVYEKRLEISAL